MDLSCSSWAVDGRSFLIGPRLPGYEDLEYIECSAEDVPATLEAVVKEGRVESAVAMHFPFPLGVTTIGRVLTPGRGTPMILASTTGTSSTVRGEAMLRNAIYGIATAKALGLKNPTVGILNVDTAQPVLRSLYIPKILYTQQLCGTEF